MAPNPYVSHDSFGGLGYIGYKESDYFNHKIHKIQICSTPTWFVPHLVGSNGVGEDVVGRINRSNSVEVKWLG